MSRVRDIVSYRELYFAKESEAVADVARQMAELHVGAILILDGQHLRGIFSERDLMLRVVLDCRNPECTPVGQVMTTAVKPTTAGTCRSCAGPASSTSFRCAT